MKKYILYKRTPQNKLDYPKVTRTTHNLEYHITIQILLDTYMHNKDRAADILDFVNVLWKKENFSIHEFLFALNQNQKKEVR